MSVKICTNKLHDIIIRYSENNRQKISFFKKIGNEKKNLNIVTILISINFIVDISISINEILYNKEFEFLFGIV